MDAVLTAERVIAVLTGAYNVAGADAAMQLIRILAADPGAIFVTGALAGLIANQGLVFPAAKGGVFAHTGAGNTIRSNSGRIDNIKVGV
jgi:hypothetical protein